MEPVMNHVVDPTIFDDAIEEFAFDYDWYMEDKFSVDELGRKQIKYRKDIIRGSLQSKGSRKVFSKDQGNTEEYKYEFYCKSLYRIKNGDFIMYNNKCLIVDFTQDYDEWGVRMCELRMVNLNSYKNLKESMEFLNGDKII